MGPKRYCLSGTLDSRERCAENVQTECGKIANTQNTPSTQVLRGNPKRENHGEWIFHYIREDTKQSRLQHSSSKSVPTIQGS